MKKIFFLDFVLIVDIIHMFLSFIIHVLSCKTLEDVIISIIALLTAYEFPLHVFCGINPRNGRKYILFNNIKIHRIIFFFIGFFSLLCGSYLFWVKHETACAYLVIYGGTLMMCFILQYGKINIPSILKFFKKNR